MQEILTKQQYVLAEQQNYIADEVTYVMNDVKASKDEKIISDRVEKISRLLSIPQLLTKSNAANEELKDIRKQFPKDGFRWLSKVNDYDEWLKLSSDFASRSSSRLLFVSGGIKTGKCCLVASIEEDLRNRKIANLAIAYHAFTGVDSKSTKTANKDDVIYALKSMALQLATQSKKYAIALSQLKEKDLRISNTRECSAVQQWWDKLRFAKGPEIQEPLIIFLLLDGLNQLPEVNADKFLKLLRESSSSLAKENRLQLRILVARRNDSKFWNLHIRITNHTMDDINSFIEQDLNKLDPLQGQDIEMKRIRQSIREKLAEVAKGSFSIIIEN